MFQKHCKRLALSLTLLVLLQAVQTSSDQDENRSLYEPAQGSNEWDHLNDLSTSGNGSWYESAAGSIQRRRLYQKNPDTKCNLDNSLTKTYFDQDQNTWSVSQDLVEEIDSFQTIVDCAAATKADLLLEAGLQLTLQEALEISHSVNFIGPESKNSKNSPTITCGNRNQILKISDARKVSLENVRIADCRVVSGSVIEINNAKVKITNCEFESNKGTNGGVIFASSGSDLDISNSAFRKNSAVNGGAVFVRSSTLRVEGTTFESNSANDIGGAIVSSRFIRPINDTTVNASSSEENQPAGPVQETDHSDPIFELEESEFASTQARVYGGAIFNFNDSTLSLRDPEFPYIPSPDPTNPDSSSLQDPQISLDVKDCICVGNSATWGGCIATVAQAEVRVKDSILQGNNATISGGAFFSRGVRHNFLSNLRLIQNKAIYGGGICTVYFSQSGGLSANLALAEIHQSEFSENTAQYGGGAYSAGVQIVNLTDCHFLSNKASLETTEVEDGVAGGIYLFADGYKNKGSIQTILNNSTRADTQAEVIRRKALQSIGAQENPFRTADLVPQLICVLENITFRNNVAEGNVGALSAQDGCLVVAKKVLFEGGMSRHAGAAHFVRSNFFCTECVFRNNSARTGTGALGLHGVPEYAVSGSTIAEVFLKDALFVDNRAAGNGGGLSIEGLTCYAFLLGNVTFEQNSARGGGGISFEHAGTLEITNSTFKNNKALKGGGGIATSYLQFRQTSAYLKNVLFEGNEAPLGGAIGAIYHVHLADTGQPRYEFDRVKVAPSLKIIDSTIRNNSATEGGAINLNGVPALFQNITVDSNKAIERGGGIIALRGSVVKITNSKFTSNKGGDGGALMLDELAMAHLMDCVIEGNTANWTGGGLSLTTRSYPSQDISLQCDLCDIANNSANRGGGLHIGYILSPTMKDFKPEDDSLVVLRGTRFRDNRARVGGAAVMAAHPTNVYISCQREILSLDEIAETLSAGYLSQSDIDQLPKLTDERACITWTGNEVDEGGFGDNVASYVKFALAHFNLDQSNKTKQAEVDRLQPSPKLPSLYVILVDEFDQQFAEPRLETQTLTVTVDKRDAEGIELFGQTTAEFKRGNATLDQVNVRAKPGVYTLYLDFSDRKTKSLEVSISVLGCELGWEELDEGKVCEICDSDSYNFSPEERCKKCPDHISCRHWGNAPKKGYWLPFPCYTDAMECFSEKACDYRAREDRLAEFFDEEISTPTCNLTEAEAKEFQERQCNEGRTGLLCGSCKDGFGKKGLECAKCAGSVAAVVVYISAVFWLLFIVLVGTRANLNFRVTPEQRVQQLRPGPVQERISPLGYQVHERASGRLPVESRIPSAASIPSQAPLRGVRAIDIREEGPSLNRTGANPGHQTDEELLVLHDQTKRIVSETFKLFINFAQVNGMALSIDTRWTQALSSVLGSLDFIGAFSSEAGVSLDCVFSDSFPRSIGREIMFLALPLISIFIYTMHWSLRMSGNPQARVRRIILSTVVTFYIVYIGLTRRLIRMLYCVEIVDGTSPEDISEDKYWTEDTDVKCYAGYHAAVIGLLVVPMIILISIFFPICSAYTLIRCKFRGTLHTMENKETVGFMFRGYKDSLVFWDSVIMIRKALIALIVGFGYPLGSDLQGILATFVLFLSFCGQITLRPFNEDFRHLNDVETLALGISVMTYFSGLAMNEENIHDGGRIAISLLVMVMIVFFCAYILGSIYIKISLLMRLSLQLDGVQLRGSESCGSFLRKWVGHNISKRFRKRRRRAA